MKSMYWFSVLDGIDTIGVIASVIIALALVILFVAFIVNLVEYDNDTETLTALKRILLKLSISIGVAVIVAIFVPSKEDMYMIYGVGGTLDYLKEHPDENKLPDKTLECLNVAMDEYINKNKSEE
jgi:FtsH-binding integral membrane protein